MCRSAQLGSAQLAFSASLNTCCEIRLCTISRLFWRHTGDFVAYTTSRNLPSLRIVWLHGADSRSTAIRFRSVIKGIQTMDTSSDIRQRWLEEERAVRSTMAE